MSLKVNVSGTWKYLSKAYVKVSDAWKPCTNIHVNINGTWKPLYSYKWSTGNWSACSATCGGGTQTRTVTCTRSHASNNSLDQQTVDDTYCTKIIGTKPATSQSCNTQTCIECKAQKGSASRICQHCNVRCPKSDCYFVFDQAGGDYFYFWGSQVGTTYNYKSLTKNGYLYTGHDQLWYDDYKWVYSICKRLV